MIGAATFRAGFAPVEEVVDCGIRHHVSSWSVKVGHCLTSHPYARVIATIKELADGCDDFPQMVHLGQQR
jgi:hypothetical protein